MTVKDLLFESNLSCYETKYRLKDQAFRQLNLMGKKIIRNRMLLKNQPIFRIWRWRAGGYPPHGHSRKTAFKPIANFLWCRSRTFRPESSRCKEGSFVEFNAHAVGFRYCLRYRYGHCTAIRVFLYYVVGCTTSFDWVLEKLSQLWVRLFGKKLKIVARQDRTRT